MPRWLVPFARSWNVHSAADAPVLPSSTDRIVCVFQSSSEAILPVSWCCILFTDRVLKLIYIAWLGPNSIKPASERSRMPLTNHTNAVLDDSTAVLDYSMWSGPMTDEGHEGWDEQL